MRIIVCGGRDYADGARVAWALGHYVGTGPHLLVHGAYKVFNEDGSPYLLRPGVKPGADRLAHFFALAWGWQVEPHVARWRELGGRAGPERNRHMASLGADGVIAFPGGSGTASMVACARRADIPVWDLRSKKGAAPAHRALD